MRILNEIVTRSAAELEPGDLARVFRRGGKSNLVLCGSLGGVKRFLVLESDEGADFRVVALSDSDIALSYGNKWFISIDDSICHSSNGDFEFGQLVLVGELAYTKGIHPGQFSSDILISISREDGLWDSDIAQGGAIYSRGLVFPTWKISVKREGPTGPGCQDLVSFGQ